MQKLSTAQQRFVARSPSKFRATRSVATPFPSGHPTDHDDRARNGDGDDIDRIDAVESQSHRHNPE